MLQVAKVALEKEEADIAAEKETYLAENCPPLSLPSSLQELQEFCKKLHAKLDVVDEERYDLDSKVQKSTKELEDLNQKIFDLRGKFKRPALKRVRMSADAMLRALLGSKHKVNMELRANLKQVKKEDTDKVRLEQQDDDRFKVWLIGSNYNNIVSLLHRRKISVMLVTGVRTLRRNPVWKAERRCSSLRLKDRTRQRPSSTPFLTKDALQI
uniref:Troponin I, fast skeletal muscle n=1 Tax=Leptobrachium leishanense TaxID=445787 RepID=A0A8C5QZB4_9ANUR